MKASHRPSASAARMLAMLTTGLLLVQCSMPPQEAWRTIQTQGLLTYLSQPSPPFHTSGSYARRYSTLPQRSYRGTSGYTTNRYLSPLSTSSASSAYVPRSGSGGASPAVTPHVKIPVEEPRHTPAPQVSQTPATVSTTPKTEASEAPALSTESLPYGIAVPGRANMVNSPYAGKTQLVDISGMSAGQTVKCPYTGKLFRVPPTQQATNTVKPQLESKLEAPKASDEPPAGDKKP